MRTCAKREKCRNNYTELVPQVVGKILCEHCKRRSNFEPLRESDLIEIHNLEEKSKLIYV